MSKCTFVVHEVIVIS